MKNTYCADLALCYLSPVPISHNFFQSFSVHVMSLNTKYLVVKWVLSRLKCTKIYFGRGSAPDSAGELTTLPRPLVGWGGGHPLLGRGTPLPRYPPPRRLRRLDLRVRLIWELATLKRVLMHWRFCDPSLHSICILAWIQYQWMQCFL